MGKIGIVTDIQQAFLNIEIHPKHRDLLRFILLKEIGYSDMPCSILREIVFKDICNHRSDWDALVTEGIAQEWYMHLNDLKSFDNIRVP